MANYIRLEPARSRLWNMICFLLLLLIFSCNETPILTTANCNVFAKEFSENPHAKSSNPNRAPTVQLCRMLYARQVRTKLRITDSEFQQISSEISVLRNFVPDVAKFAAADRIEREKFLEEIVVQAERLDEMLYAKLLSLLGKEGIDALMGVYLHYYGDIGVLNQRISDRIRLTQEQRGKIEKGIEDFRLEKSTVLNEVADGIQIEGSNVAPLLLMRADAYTPTVHRLLTASQLQALEDLKAHDVWKNNGQLVPRYTFGW